MSGVSGIKTPQGDYYSFDILKDKDEVVFIGMMELGWEVQRWAPPVNFFIKNNPKRYIVATLFDRIDLFKGYNAYYPIKVEGFYTRKRPCMYLVYGLDKGEYEGITAELKRLYPNAYLCEPPPNRFGRNVFQLDNMDFDFQPRVANKKVIDKILSSRNKPVITLAPRHRSDREDVASRNWRYWHELYDMLSDFTVLVAGTGESYIRPKKHPNCFCLEDYNTEGTSTIGLVIEGMKASKLTVGQQSGNPILSMQLGVPVISWGHEKRRHEGPEENPRRTRCHFFESKEYNIKPEVIYQKILEMVNE